MYKVSPAFSKNYQKKFMGMLVVWAIGAFFSSQLCDSVGSISIPVVENIPSISSYALATKYSCQVNNIWVYGWLTFPLFFIFIIREGSRNLAYEADWQVKIFSIGLLVLALHVCVLGIYEPYPGENNGRFAYQFRETEMGAIISSVIFWSFFWSMIMVNYQWMIGVFKFNK